MSFILKRMLHNWRLLLTLALGVILGTAILASAPLLVDTVINFTLPYKLNSLDPLTTNLRISTFSKLDLAQYQALDESARILVNQRLDGHLSRVDGLASSNWLYPWLNGQLAADQRIALSFYQALTDRVTFVNGDWPSSSALQNDVVQVVVSEPFAEMYGLQVGDRLPVSKQQSDQNPSLWLSISGIVRPIEPRQIYWLGKYNRLLNLSSDRWNAQFNVFIPQEQFFSIATQLFPTANTRLDWNIIINPTSFQVADTSSTRSQINRLRIDLKELPGSFSLDTKLDQVLADFSTHVKVIRITMYILIGEVLFLSLYYIAMIASLSTQQAEGEFATLSSRGASFSQLLQIQFAEVFNIALLALIVGPAVGLFIVWGLAKFGPLSDIAPAGWRISLSSAGLIAACFSVAVCIGGMILPGGSTIRRSIVAYSQSKSRNDRPQWWQHAYLDVFILVISLLLLWRLRFYGNLASSTSSSGRVDWLLILSPLVLLISSATILLRIFPPILRFVSRLVTRAGDISTTLALWQTSRYPAHVTRLVLLLTLTTALGILTTGMNATLKASEFERAVYAAGSDLRMAFNSLIPKNTITHTSGVDASSVVWRGTGSSRIRYHNLIPTFDILAIEPLTFSHVTRYRDDFSDQPMGELLGELLPTSKPKEISTISLPGKPGRLGLWVYDRNYQSSGLPVDIPFVADMAVFAKFQTADSQFFVVNLSRMTRPEFTQDPEWNYFESELPALPPDSYPLAFHSFWFTMRPTDYVLVGGRVDLILDDFSVIDAENGDSFIFEGFDEIQQIWQTSGRFSNARYTNSEPAHGGTASLLFSFPFQFNPLGYGLMPSVAANSEPFLTLVSREFSDITKLTIGDELSINILGMQTPIKIAGVVSYFPTLYDSPGRGFIILPRDALMTRLNRVNRNPIFPDEIWLETINEQVSTQVQNSFPNASQTWNLGTERLALKADALLLGLRSVIYLAYLLTAILSLVGFATHFYLTARQRETQFSVLRSLGLSVSQMYRWLLLEQAIAVLTGLALGTLLGLLLNRLILTRLPITFGDQLAIPPFLVLDDWNAMIRLYLTLVIAFILSLGIATALLWRSNIHRAMRIGQE